MTIWINVQAIEAGGPFWCPGAHVGGQVREVGGLNLRDDGKAFTNTVTSVHVGAGGQPLVTDGPFLEGTEVIGGVAEVEVADLDEALHIARSWSDHFPENGVVEIWPVVEELHPHG